MCSLYVRYLINKITAPDIGRQQNYGREGAQCVRIILGCLSKILVIGE